MAIEDPKISWKMLCAEINSSVFQLFHHPTSFLYFFSVMILGGAAGIWIPILSGHGSVGPDAFATYVFAVLAPIIADLLLQTADENKTTLSIRSFVLFGTAFAYSISIISLIRQDEFALPFGIYAFLFSLIVCAVVLIQQERFAKKDNNGAYNFIGGASASICAVAGDGLPKQSDINSTMNSIAGTGLPSDSVIN